ncbi:MAG TPA: SRPBCC family protein [Gaiellaceae bacterium]|nr:SRPBCC family protein [Gaiellaceae bacterium]
MRIRTLAGAIGVGTVVWALVVRGSLTLDLGVGRRFRRLGPITITVAAPREVVFDVVSGPYAERVPRALRETVEVLERGEDVLLAAHRTKAYGLTATTVETVRFERPERVHFRLVRGPVPHVVETFSLREVAGGTELQYSGELGTDFWALGRFWGAAVARTWEATVASSLESARIEAERRAARA